MGIRIIDDTTGLELASGESTSFSAQLQITVQPLGNVIALDIGPFFISTNKVENVLDNPQWQSIYGLFVKMMPTVTEAWTAMTTEIETIIVSKEK